ncbi:acyltransferase [Sphaerospermopsis sp. FACHB-1094]|uniref:acyltransferase family protein n=1 Tax=Sphaerospermopsis sp. FACHB-1094 TaxID=2692861 RepID=UPI0016860BC9|nr:acyltransferase [Sphaerospermopsis sp. FACHB-1094]MBD2133184.1 acyltransferase [Sphaerospermopsis sp. FACHB-1094]
MVDLHNKLLSTITRETSGRQFFPVIDGLRFVAILGVVLYHIQDYFFTKTGEQNTSLFLVPLLKGGYLGVQLFFAISGFMISLPFLQGYSPNFFQYIKRRLLRLGLPYIINLLIIYTLLVLVLKQDFYELLPHFFASVAYMHNIIYGSMSKINFVAWSLEVEFQFYLIAPIFLIALTKINNKIRKFVLLFLLVLGGISASGYISYPWIKGATIIHNFGFFIAGILAANIFVFDWKTSVKQSYFWDLICIILVSFLFFPLHSRTLLMGLDEKLYLPILTYIILISVLKSKLINSALSQPYIYLIGGMCYSIYLYHFYVISLVGRVLLPLVESLPVWLQFTIVVVVMLPTILLASVLFFIFFEKPFMKRKTNVAITKDRTDEKPCI